MMIKTRLWRFYIDTDAYTGNFERELTGYVTGQRASKYNGEQEARAFHREVEGDPFKALIGEELVENFPQICDIAQTPGTELFNTVVIYFKEHPTPELIQLLKDRAQAFAANPGTTRSKTVRPPFGIKGFRMDCKVTEISTESSTV